MRNQFNDVDRVSSGSKYLLELVQVRCAFVGPEARDISGKFKGWLWLPIFEEATLIRRDDTIILIIVLLGN